MRILSWNCQGAFGRKIDRILELKPDIAIIQECEILEKLRQTVGNKIPKKSLWFGGYIHKGLGVFMYSDYDVKVRAEYDKSIAHVVPIEVKSRKKFLLYAIWAMWDKDPRKSFTYRVEEAIRKYKNLLKDYTSVMIGDYNSPNIQKASLVDSLSNLGIFSVYHYLSGEEFGKHTKFTWYNQRKKEKKYLLDYCFVSQDILKKNISVNIGKYEDWIKYSDHCPLIVDIEGL